MDERHIVLSVEELRKVFRIRRGPRQFDDLVAVAGLSFDLARFESLAIVGESGSGKTTTARMIMGLETPTSGRVVLPMDVTGTRARGSAQRRARARAIQMVFQNPYASLDRRQTVGEGLAELLRQHAHDDSFSPRPVEELLDLVGLSTQHLKSLPRELSGGQRQRVAIARALAIEPRVLLLDEPVAALDVSIQAQILNLLADLRSAEGVSYVLISHDLGVVRQLTERIKVLRRGVVVESGETASVLDDPQHEYTQRLRDSIPAPEWGDRT